MPLTGEVFTVDEGLVRAAAASRVQRFDAAAVFQSAFAIDAAYEGGASAVAVDGVVRCGVCGDRGQRRSPCSGEVHAGVTGVRRVRAYALDVGELETSISPGAQVAVDPVDGTVYVTATDVMTGRRSSKL